MNIEMEEIVSGFESSADSLQIADKAADGDAYSDNEPEQNSNVKSAVSNAGLELSENNRSIETNKSSNGDDNNTSMKSEGNINANTLCCLITVSISFAGERDADKGGEQRDGEEHTDESSDSKKSPSVSES